jgi:hypothetical protein
VKTNIVSNDIIILDGILFTYICCELIVCFGYTCMSENLMHMKKIIIIIIKLRNLYNRTGLKPNLTWFQV